MPHLNIETYINQYNWLVIILLLSYFYNYNTVIYNITKTIKTRNYTTQDNNKSKKQENKEITNIKLPKKEIISDNITIYNWKHI